MSWYSGSQKTAPAVGRIVEGPLDQRGVEQQILVAEHYAFGEDVDPEVNWRNAVC